MTAPNSVTTTLPAVIRKQQHCRKAIAGIKTLSISVSKTVAADVEVNAGLPGQLAPQAPAVLRPRRRACQRLSAGMRRFAARSPPGIDELPVWE